MNDEKTAAEGNGDTPFKNENSPKMILRSLSAVAIVAVLGWAAYYFTTTDHAPQPGQAKASSRPIEAKVITITPHDVPYTSKFLAQTEASESVQIRARVSGFLTEQGFKEGESIEKGKVLFRIDPEPFQVALNQADAGLLSARANITRADQQVKRFEGLAKIQQAATNELEQAQEGQKVAQAAVQTQQALVEKAKLDLDYATISSPIKGVIGERLQDVGSYVGPGADALLAKVLTVDPINVRFNISEKDILAWQRLSEADKVTNIPVDEITVKVILPDGRIFPHEGTIDYIDVAIDPTTASAVVRAKVPNPEHTLRPGQFVNVEVSGNMRTKVVTIPQIAVNQNPTGAMVYVLDDKGTAAPRPVELGEWAGDDWIINSGLKEGDRVIVDHLMQIRPGAPVTAAEAAPQPPTKSNQKN